LTVAPRPVPAVPSELQRWLDIADDLSVADRLLE
jgi:hypothetical protein